MWPPIEVRKKHDASETGPVQVGFTLGRRRRTFQSKRTLPQLTRFARRRVRRPDGPRLRTLLEYGVRGSTPCRPSHKSQRLAVRRPAWTRIARGRRREINNRRGVIRVDTDERVIAAIRNESQTRSVR